MPTEDAYTAMLVTISEAADKAATAKWESDVAALKEKEAKKSAETAEKEQV